eukprot:scaffold18040_cov63-Phaeocystis_antarctica.AAC.4
MRAAQPAILGDAAAYPRLRVLRGGGVGKRRRGSRSPRSPRLTPARAACPRRVARPAARHHQPAGPRQPGQPQEARRDLPGRRAPLLKPPRGPQYPPPPPRPSRGPRARHTPGRHPLTPLARAQYEILYVLSHRQPAARRERGRRRRRGRARPGRQLRGGFQVDTLFGALDQTRRVYVYYCAVCEPPIFLRGAKSPFRFCRSLDG